jgi:MFS family permease
VSPGKLGPLREREFRLLFAGRTTSMLGSAIARVALAFAVLDLTGSASDLGIVLAAYSAATIILLLVGGVWADRLPRHRVMVGANLTSGATQAVVAALLLTGRAEVWELAILAFLNGAASAFFFPASSGIVPQTVPAELQQQANATLRLGLNGTNIVGSALGGVLVAATNPGWAIAVDAATFGLAAAAIAGMRLPPGLRLTGSSVVRELREGWADFLSRGWLWTIVLQFGVVNAVESGALGVLGPTVTKAHLGGAAAWGAVLTATSIGLILSGVVMLHWRPRRILYTATLAVFPLALPLLALARPAPLAIVIVAGFAGGFCVEVFGVLWDTAMQQEIPQEKLSRLYSYDALGSWALMPVALAVIGPVSAAIGTRATLLASAALVVGATLPVLLSNDVRRLERRGASRALAEDIAA